MRARASEIVSCGAAWPTETGPTRATRAAVAAVIATLSGRIWGRGVWGSRVWARTRANRAVATRRRLSFFLARLPGQLTGSGGKIALQQRPRGTPPIHPKNLGSPARGPHRMFGADSDSAVAARPLPRW